MSEGQAKFEGWAIIEMMGHQSAIGYVTTENYGAASLFRIDTPEMPERDFKLKRPEVVDGKWAPAGSEVRRPLLAAHSQLIGPGSIYRLTPCDEEAARKAIESAQGRPLILLSMPADGQPKQLEMGAAAELTCDDCGQVVDREGNCGCAGLEDEDEEEEEEMPI
jgi:hypothetical protein